jgi:hypothetical protein
MIIVERGKEVEIKDWVSAELLFIKKGYVIPPDAEKLEVKNIYDLTAELSAWGIPWKRLKWTY